MLSDLQKDCQGINLSEIGSQRSQKEDLAQRLALRRKELEEVSRAYVNYEESIQENMVAKARRNKNVSREIDACDRRVAELH
jgi:hypothetical protein